MLFGKVFKLIRKTTRTMKAFLDPRTRNDRHWLVLSTEYREKLVLAVRQAYQLDEDKAADIVSDAFAAIVTEPEELGKLSDKTLRYFLARLCNKAVRRRYGDRRTRESRAEALKQYQTFAEGLLARDTLHERRLDLLRRLRQDTVDKARDPHFSLPGATRADIQRWVMLQDGALTETDVAKFCGLTQPTVSISVRHVEDALAKLGRRLLELYELA